MICPRFLQIHTLTSYTAALLNRDDSGLAKRLPYGGVLRTRISSQCLKRHWRIADDPHALGKIDGATAAFRSRELVTRKVIGPLRDGFPEDVVEGGSKVSFKWLSMATREPIARVGKPCCSASRNSKWLIEQARRLAKQADGNAEEAATIAKNWRNEFTANIKAMRKSSSLPAGLTSALFGRMVTSDTDANITAPVHVAHAFTVHEEEPESDYFTAVDDLSENEPGADTIQDTELTSGLFYGYVVVDLKGLLENLGGDSELAGYVLHNLVYLIAEISPGCEARFDSSLWSGGPDASRSWRPATAELGRGPTGNPVRPNWKRLRTCSLLTLPTWTGPMKPGKERRVLLLSNRPDVPGAERGSLADLAGWAQTLPERACSMMHRLARVAPRGAPDGLRRGCNRPGWPDAELSGCFDADRHTRQRVGLALVGPESPPGDAGSPGVCGTLRPERYSADRYPECATGQSRQGLDDVWVAGRKGRRHLRCSAQAVAGLLGRCVGARGASPGTRGRKTASR